MKRNALVVLLVLLFAVPVSAQSLSGFASFEILSGGRCPTTPLLNTWLQTGRRQGVFLFAWTQHEMYTNQKWSEVYAGYHVYPRSWLQLALGTGIEDASPKWRLGWQVWAGGHGLNFTSSWEQGGSGAWDRTTFTAQVHPRVALGVFQQWGLGAGPLMEFKATKRVTPWVTILRNSGEFHGMVGVRFAIQ